MLAEPGVLLRGELHLPLVPVVDDGDGCDEERGRADRECEPNHVQQRTRERADCKSDEAPPWRGFVPFRGGEGR